ncbi:MAG: tetratricopeptide repeat protein [Burkholderiales bacterium]|nr:tetratricopeptide repeat protein [Burkholderiales bacterium]
MRVAAAIVGFLFAAAVHADPYEVDPEAAARDPDYAEGKRAMEQKDWARAVERFKRAAVRDPDNPDLQNYIGYSHRNLKQFDLAFTHYRRAIELNPRHRGAHEYIGETYLLVGDVAGARRHLQALRDICLLGCEELTDLERAIAKAGQGPSTR